MKRFVLMTTIFAAAAVSVLSLGGDPARATYPGANGRISFGRYNRAVGDYQIYTANLDGTHERQLTTMPSEKSDWSPDGARIAYDFVDPNGNVQIATLNAADGSGGVQLTAAPGFHGEPNYSPNGSRIAFDSDMGNHPAGEGIYAMNASDGGSIVRVTTNPSGGFDGTPKWSPDGTRIAFIRYKPLPADPSQLLTAVFLVNTNGTGLKQLTDWALNAQDEDWSPDGKWIAFDAREYAPSGSQIWLIHPGGNGLHRISSPSPRSTLFGPVFSPDGSLVLVYGSVGSRAGLWTMQTDGSSLHLLPVSTPPALAFADWGTAPAL